MNFFRRAGSAPCIVYALVVALAGCATSSPLGSGATQEQVRGLLGVPRAAYALATGQRLFYSGKPGERLRYDFDANDRLVSMEQVFTRPQFQEFAQGRHDSAEVQRTLGPPMRRKEDGEKASVWTYSWLDFGTWRLANFRFDAAGLVQGVEFSEDTLADDRYR
ncbi:MAG: hypothetical protein KA504_13110 [Giesbergeria sp.]|jgi:hypothetical protein|nr:hypothetical protein [Giesbergeria sp.]